MTREPRYRGVLFDLDGTLADTCELILQSMRHATMKVLGENHPDDVLMSGVGTPLYDQMLLFAHGDIVRAQELVREFRAYNESVHDQRVRACPGVREALAVLRDARIPMAVVTSKRHELALRGLKVCGLADLVGFVIGPDDFPAHKPDPGPVLEGCRRLGVAPGDCLYVGDSVFDIQAGNAAGCATVAVGWGVSTLQALAAQNPTYAIASAGELPPIVMG